jgi:hypothetical protein
VYSCQLNQFKFYIQFKNMMDCLHDPLSFILTLNQGQLNLKEIVSRDASVLFYITV